MEKKPVFIQAEQGIAVALSAIGYLKDDVTNGSTIAYTVEGRILGFIKMPMDELLRAPDLKIEYLTVQPRRKYQE